MYLLMDPRAGVSDNTDNGTVLLSGNAKEICQAANTNEYGKDCVVVNHENIKIMWEWFATGKWIPDN